MDLKTYLAIGGCLFGLVGVGLNLDRFNSERPRLDLTPERIVIESGASPLHDLADSFAEIEAKDGEVTAAWVNDLRNMSLDIDEETPPEELADLQRELQRAITFFSDQAPTWSAVDIRVGEGTIEWPDGTIVGYEALSLFIDSEVFAQLDQAERDGSISDSLLRAVQIEASSLYGPPFDQSMRDQVAIKLRTIRQVVEDHLNEANRKLVVEVTFRNGSRLPNSVLTPALLRMYRDSVELVDIPLHRREGEPALRALSSGSLVFESSRLSTLSEEDTKRIRLGFAAGWECLVVVGDVSGRHWSASTSCTGFSSALKVRRLKAAADEASRGVVVRAGF
jgi:hypothetical protein